MLVLLSLLTGILIILIFYNFSSNLKNFYLELKSPYTKDGKYLAVVTKNGLWIRDKVEEKTIVINSSRIDQNYLFENFITEFDSNYNVLEILKVEKCIKKEWLIYEAKIYNNNNYNTKEIIKINTNFDYKKIQSLYSNLTSLSLLDLYELRANYKKLNYSIIEVDLHLLKIISYPIYLVLMSILAALIMFRIKNMNSTTFKISIGLFCSYYILFK